MENFALLQTHLNYVWVLLCAALVFFMQAGFMCLEAGLASAKNSINVAIKNLADFVLAVILFWAVGFGIMFGDSVGGYFGSNDFFMPVDDPWRVAFFVFQAVFVGTAATIDSGAVAGRTKFWTYLLLSCIVSGLIYPVFGHWAWGGLFHDQSGWLEAMGFKDFAGSTVVHSVGGWMALVGVIILGPRIGKFDEDGTPRKILPHSMTLAYLGTFVLFFGWFGFNCGSTLEASLDIAGIAMNTMLAACFGCLSSSALSWMLSEHRRPEGEMIANGVLGGLVGITAGCAFVDTQGAMWIGLGSGVAVYFGSLLIEKVLKLDDVVGAIAVHGFCGAWGTLAVGFFILPQHLGELSRWDQILIQGLGVVVCFAWTFGVGYILAKGVDVLSGGMRVSREDELVGLNFAEHGARMSHIETIETTHYITQTGDLSRRVDVEIDTEMGDVAQTFNRLLDKVETVVSESSLSAQSLEQALSDVSEAVGGVRSAVGQEQQALKDSAASMEKLDESTSSIGESINQLESKAVESSSSALEMSSNIEHVAQSSNQLSEVVNSVGDSVEKLAASVKHVAEQAEKMQQTFMGTVSAVEQMEASNKEIESHTRDVSKIAGEVQSQTEAGRQALQTTIEGIVKVETAAHETEGAMQQLVEQAQNIGGMVTVIEDITEQTSLLALNASIIAAQAGEHGRGFAVVAEEIRELASRTRTSTQGIVEMVQGIQQVTSTAVDSNRSSNAEVRLWREQSEAFSTMLSEIFAQVQGVSTQIHRIAQSTAEQSKGTQLIRNSIDSVMGMVERSAEETMAQSLGISAVTESARTMRVLTEQVKSANWEQSETSKFIARALESIRSQVAQIRDLCLTQQQQREEMAGVMETVSDSNGLTRSSLGKLEEAIEAMNCGGESLKKAMSIFVRQEVEAAPVAAPELVFST